MASDITKPIVHPIAVGCEIYYYLWQEFVVYRYSIAQRVAMHYLTICRIS